MLALCELLITYVADFAPLCRYITLSECNASSHFFIKVVQIMIFYSTPEQENLCLIYNAYLTCVIKEMLKNPAAWTKNKTFKLATSLVAIYAEVT